MRDAFRTHLPIVVASGTEVLVTTPTFESSAEADDSTRVIPVTTGVKTVLVSTVVGVAVILSWASTAETGNWSTQPVIGKTQKATLAAEVQKSLWHKPFSFS